MMTVDSGLLFWATCISWRDVCTTGDPTGLHPAEGRD